VSAGDAEPEEESSSPVDLSNVSEPEIPVGASRAFFRSLRHLSEFLAFIAGILRDEDQVRRPGFLILRLGMAGALIAVPVAVLGYIILGSTAGDFAAGIGTGSAIATTISVYSRLGRKKVQ
jgi:hypothetical protein